MRILLLTALLVAVAPGAVAPGNAPENDRPAPMAEHALDGGLAGPDPPPGNPCRPYCANV